MTRDEFNKTIYELGKAYDGVTRWNENIREKLDEARRLAEEWREHCSVLYDVKEEAYGTPDIPDPETTLLPWEQQDEDKD